MCLLVLVAACRQATDAGVQPTRETTVCAMATTPKVFDGRVIQVRARVMTDGLERTVLIDGNCPDVGVALGWGPTVSGASSLTDVLYGHGRSPHADIEATFVGRFFLEDGRRRLEATQVMDLTVRRASRPGS